MSRIPGPRSPITLAKLAAAVTSDPYRALLHVRDTYGPVSAIDLRPLGIAVLLLGPEANELVLSTHSDRFEWHGAMRSLVPIEGETSLILSDGDDHARRRKVVQPAFHKRAIDDHLDLLVGETDRIIDRWAVGDEIDAARATATAVERMAIAVLGGPELRAHSHEISARLAPAIEFVNAPLHKQAPLPWPGTRYHRARASRHVVEGLIDDEIDRRTRRGEVGEDVLARLIASEGSTMTRQEVHDQLISLMANYDTTSAAMGWAVHRLVTEPLVWARAADELEAEVGTAPLTIDALNRLPYLDGVVNETLRLHPPSVYSPREVVEAFEFRGHRIPKGAMVMFSPFVTGRDEREFPDPEAFRPERWDTTRPDHHAPHPYAFVPFGGRSRRCIGFAFALLQLKVVIAQLVRRTDLTPIGAAPVPRGSVAVRPSGGVPVRVRAVRRRSDDQGDPDRPGDPAVTTIDLREVSA